MAKSLYCKLNLFTMPQTLILFEDDQILQSYQCVIEDLINVINNMVLTNNDIVKIELFGAEQFIKGLSQKIKNKNVRIYINGEVYDQ